MDMAAARRRSVVLIALISISLPALAMLQSRWLGDLMHLERLRARDSIEKASRQFADDFDLHLARLYERFCDPVLAQVDFANGAVTVQRLLAASSPVAVAGPVWLIDRDASGFHAREITRTSVSEEQPQLPAWLGQDPDQLRQTLLDRVESLVVPHHVPGRERWIVVGVNARLLVDTLLPGALEHGLESRHAVRYDVMIDRDAWPPRVVQASSPGLTARDFADWVSEVPLFALHGRDMAPAAASRLAAGASGHRWRLFVRPRPDDVGAALGGARTRNLLMSFGALALLGASVTLLVVSVYQTQRASREQLEVVARISHELRTPLATIRCAGENLADGVVGSAEDSAYYGQMILKEARRLTRTVQDILLCCRLQARPDTVLHFESLDLEPIVHAAVADSRMVVGDGAPGVDITIEPGLPAVSGDRDALAMVIKNLVMNALKYGGGSPVRVSARSRRTAGGREVVLVVRDSGPGIPVDELARIFQPFFRGRSARNRQIDGSGIGLSLVRQAVESHGGRVQVSSAEHRGTTFTLHIPALRPSVLPALDTARTT